jgi:hypothetical protein
MNDAHALRDDRIAIATEVRAEAFLELSSVMRHELATVLHVGQAALEACSRGDVVRGHRLLASLCDRLRSSHGELSGYGARSEGARAVRLAEVQPSVVALLRARHADADIDIDLADDVAAVPILVPRSVLSLSLLVAASGIAGGAAPGAVVRMRVRSHEADSVAGMLGIVCGGSNAPSDSWHVGWAARELERCGGRLRGPVEVDGAEAPVFALSLPVEGKP